MKKCFLYAAWIAVLLAAIGLMTAWLMTETTHASLVNQGYPVRCYNVSTTSEFFLSCINTQGTPSFVGNQRVPTGYYFLITDIMITAHENVVGNDVSFKLKDCWDTASVMYPTTNFRVLDGSTLGQHFIAPMWVLPEDHRLGVELLPGNQAAFDLRVNGFLVTNVSYLPVVLHLP